MEFVLHTHVEIAIVEVSVVSHMRVSHLKEKKMHGKLQVVDNHVVVHVLLFKEENVIVELHANLVTTQQVKELSQISLRE